MASLEKRSRLQSLDRIPEVLSRRLEPCCTSGARFRHQRNEQQFVPKTCREYLDMDPAYTFDLPAVDTVIWANLHKHCLGLAWLATASPSSRSFVREFALGRDGLSSIPPVVGNFWATEDGRDTESQRRRELTDRGASYAALLGDYEVSERDPDYLCLRRKTCEDGHRCAISFTLLARGEFDGDGLEDLLIYVTEDGGGASMAFAFRLYLLTRTSPTSVLQVVRSQ